MPSRQREVETHTTNSIHAFSTFVSTKRSISELKDGTLYVVCEFGDEDLLLYISDGLTYAGV